MFSFAQVMRIGSRGDEVFQSTREVSLVEAQNTQETARPDILPRYQAFPTFPGMKASSKKDFERGFRLPDLVVERKQFYRHIVSLGNEIQALLEESQPFHRPSPRSFAQLIQFVNHARILRVRGERAFVGLECRRRVVANVEIRDAKVSPGDGKSGIKRNTLLPQRDGILIALLIVGEIGEIVCALGVRWVLIQRLFQGGSFLQSRRKAIVGAGRRSQGSIFSRQVLIAG